MGQCYFYLVLSLYRNTEAVASWPIALETSLISSLILVVFHRVLSFLSYIKLLLLSKSLPSHTDSQILESRRLAIGEASATFNSI